MALAQEVYPLVMTNIAMENPIFNGKTHDFNGHFPVRYVSHYQRVRNVEEPASSGAAGAGGGSSMASGRDFSKHRIWPGPLVTFHVAMQKD